MSDFTKNKKVDANQASKHCDLQHHKLERQLERQKGFTITEVLGALALGGILVGVAFSAIKSGKSTTQASVLSDAAGSMGTAIMSSAAGTGTYGNGSSLVEYLVRSEKIPGGITVSGSAPNRVLNHAFNGTVEVTGRNNNYVVTLNDIPGNICMDLFTRANSWDRVLVSSTSPASISVSSGGYTSPYTQANAVAACSEASLNRVHLIK